MEYTFHMNAPEKSTPLLSSRLIQMPLFEALRWYACAYLLILGMSLILLPSDPLAPRIVADGIRGWFTVGGGLALLWLSTLRLARRTNLITHFLVVAPQMLFAIEFLLRGVISASVILGLLAIGIMLAPFGVKGDVLTTRRPDALGIVLGLSAASNGLDFLVRPGALPPNLLISQTVAGALFLLGGVGVVVVQMMTSLPAFLRWSAHLFAGGVLLVLWAATALWANPLYWLLGAASVLRAVAILALPWWSEIAARFDGHAVRARLGFALLAASVIPPLLVLPFVLDAVGDAASLRAHQLAYSATLLVATGAGLCGWWLAGRQAAPITALMHAVWLIAEGKGVLPYGATFHFTLSNNQ